MVRARRLSGSFPTLFAPVRPAFPATLVPAVLFLAILAAGCAAPSAVPDPDPAGTALAGSPAPAAVYLGRSGLTRVTGQGDDFDAHLLIPAASVEGRWPAPGGDRVAVAYTAGDSSHLAVVDAAGTVRTLHGARGTAVYTAAWHPDGALAFGVYAPRDGTGREALGPGDLRVASAGGAPAPIGCSASKMVAAWLPGGDLVVGDGENFYRVDAGTCRTRATIPALKKHHVTFSPDGRWMAYIFRDLAYNRDARAYEPDSSLYVAAADGSGETLVLGDRYRVRHLAWAPDGSRLAFDVQDPNAPDRRQIAFYDLEAGESNFLTRAGATETYSETYSERRPLWSPDGAHLAFERSVPGSGVWGPAVRTFLTMSVQPVSGGTPWGWAGNDLLVLTAGDGLTLASVGGGAPVTLPAATPLVHVFLP